MPKPKSDALFMLIKSLSKSEKRHFQMAHKNKDIKPPLFLQLFDVLDKTEIYDSEVLLTELPHVKKQQLSNLKTNLYDHILESVRWLSREKDIRIKIRKLIDYAQVLYNKSLYRQSLKMLGKAKTLANTHNEIELKMQVLEFEKVIEARHITRSIDNRAERLSEESQICLEQLNSLSNLSNLALNMYGMYLKMGHVRNEKEAWMLRTFFENNLEVSHIGGKRFSSRQNIKGVSIKGMSFYEKVNLYQAYAWYAYILQDFLLFYRYSQKWADLFEAYPIQRKSDPTLYLKAMNNLLTAHFFNQNYEKFYKILETTENFWRENRNNFNSNTETLAFVHVYTAKINKHFLEGSFKEGISLIPELKKELKKHQNHIDQHRVLVFYYKIACLYFGSGDNNKTVTYLNRIINLKIGNLRSDIQCFARILHLIAHYELKHYDLLEYLLPSVYNFLEKHKQMSLVLEEILKSLKSFNRVGIRGLRQAFVDLKERLEEVAQNPYERRFFLYLDVISWLESKIDKHPVQDIVQEKFVNRIPRI